MPGGARKKHGSKKTSKLRKEVPQTSAAVATNETVATPNSGVVKVAAEARGGLYPDPSSDGADRVQADEKVASLSSARSSDGNVRGGNARPPATEYMIVDLNAINQLLASTVCRTCSGNNVRVVECERESGLAAKLCVVCSNCGVMKIND